MSDLRIRYVTLRAEGLDHNGAVEEIAREIGVDLDTVQRTLRQAGVKA